MKLKDLTEGLSDILYHGTRLTNAANIISTNQFALSPVTAKSEEHVPFPAKKYFFMSTSRIKSVGYAANAYSPVVFVLDGKRLMYNYPGKPTVYHSYYDKPVGKDEFEDRIFHNKPFIPNAEKYIIEIHIFLNEKDPERRDKINYIKFIHDVSDKPVYIYNDLSSFKIKNKRKTINISDIKNNLPYNQDYMKDHLKKSWLAMHKYINSDEWKEDIP